MSSRDYLKTGSIYMSLQPTHTPHQKRGGKFLQKFISSRDGPVRVHKQGKDESTQENCPTTERRQKERQVDYM